MRVALGFRPHTGWATAIALGGPEGSPVVLDRRRVDLADPVIPREVFHAARELGPREAEEFVGRAQEAAEQTATKAVGGLVAELAAGGHQVAAAGVPAGTARLPSALSKILTSHPYVHTAEGRLFREALAEAADRSGLAVSRVVLDRAAAILGHDEEALRRMLADLGRPLGPPWRQDEKDAALAAWLALAA